MRTVGRFDHFRCEVLATPNATHPDAASIGHPILRGDRQYRASKSDNQQ
jgi:hypothetical protein